MRKHLWMMTIAASACLIAGQASAMTKEEYKAAKDKIEADYKGAKAQCDTLKDNAKDVCAKDAKGKQNIAKAELEQNYKPSATHQRKVAEEKVKAEYEVAKEKCDDVKGEAKTLCMQDAKAAETQGKADIKARRM